MIPPFILAVLGSPKIATTAMMLFIFLLTGKHYEPSEDLELELRNNLIDTINSFTECGIREDSSSAKFRTARIIGGQKAGKWPWMVYLFEKKAGYICGGTLIDSQHVVTAAHCIKYWNQPEEYRVKLGEHEASTWMKNIHNVSSIIRHENYEELSLKNDIALLKLENKIIFTKNIRPVCLPSQGYPTDATYVNIQPKPHTGAHCTVLGWGETETQTEQSSVLKELKVQVKPRILCKSITTRNASAYSYRTVYKDSLRFCAGGNEGEDTCNGDSGGPLLCKDSDGKYSLHGITSYGPTPCGQPLLAGVYTQVSGYRDWINAHMK